jgi:ParB-like chromosome segregation protein Spo0J
MLGADDLRELAASIRRHGQTAPCSMDPPGGSALDGRSRVAACALAGVEPRWEVYDGDPVAFVVEANAEDRNLSTGQRAMAVAIGLVEAGLRSNGRFRRGSVP